ncbi:MAG: hypothetical protein ACYTGZ_13375 [Planctomycetota bacterium]|jgi:hypothetical protein
MRIFHRFAATLFTLLAVACSGGGGAAPARLAPAQLVPDEAPDIVILTVAGHVFGDNYAYLAEPDSITRALKETLDTLGLSHQESHYADRLYGVENEPAMAGFLNLLSDLIWIHDNWIDGQADPTRIILVAHSHGTNWAHLATALIPRVPIAYQITLDGVCFGWEFEHEEDVADWVDRVGAQASFEISSPCDAVDIPGQGDPLNVKDVVFPSVAVHLEVMSDSVAPIPFDCCENYRTDGTRTGIATYEASEGHTEVDEYGSDSAAWVVAQILAIETAGPVP